MSRDPEPRRWRDRAFPAVLVVVPAVVVLLLLHLRDLLRREACHEGALAAGGTRLVTVCFVDLVGFTALSLAASPGELGELAHGFETAAVEAAVPPVQLVKLLGDGALFVCPEPEPMVAAAQVLIGRLAARRALPGARAGLALGRAVRHAGDWYGPVVNLASRIEAAGEPGALTAERRVVETTSRSWMWEPLGSRRLPGIGDEVELYQLRSSGDAARPGAPEPGVDR